MSLCFVDDIAINFAKGKEETGAAWNRKDRWCHAGLLLETLPLFVCGECRTGAGDRLCSFSHQQEHSWLISSFQLASSADLILMLF